MKNIDNLIEHWKGYSTESGEFEYAFILPVRPSNSDIELIQNNYQKWEISAINHRPAYGVGRVPIGIQDDGWFVGFQNEIKKLTDNNESMNLDYRTTTMPGSLRTIHIITIEAESLSTTREKEVFLFAKPRIQSKSAWKELKRAVRLGESLIIRGGE